MSTLVAGSGGSGWGWRRLRAIERWLRPVTYQTTPHALLPPELHDDNPLELPRRVNGRLQH